VSVQKLLLQAVKAGGHEVRLIPGRRIVIITAAGEREVQGPAQTAAAIDQLVDSVLTEEARRGLALGRAEWGIEVAGVGPVRAVAELRHEGTCAVFSMGDGLEALVVAAAPAAAPAPGRHRKPAGGPAAEIDDLLHTMMEMRASDLHLTVGSVPVLRLDGEMRPLEGRPVLTAADTERILMSITPERNREDFTTRNDTDFTYEIQGLARFRGNLFRDRRGIGGVFRAIPIRIMTAEEIGISKEVLQLCHLPKGLVLVTGPTGSGKSTTLAALVDYINRNRTDHVITIEDPLEFVHENKKCLINQRQVGEHTRTFKDALRAALREDPDIVLVGEIRDPDTVAMALETAETGHLVFGTLRTASAPSAVDRMVDQFPADRQAQIRVMLSESLKGVVSQVLCRRAQGGRVPAFEILIGIPSVANLIREAKVFQIPSIMQTGKKYGMCLMNDSLTDLVKREIVEPQEAYARSGDKAGLLAQLRKNGIDVSWAGPEATPPA
jgi:twitching motility protein PilT